MRAGRTSLVRAATWTWSQDGFSLGLPEGGK